MTLSRSVRGLRPYLPRSWAAFACQVAASTAKVVKAALRRAFELACLGLGRAVPAVWRLRPVRVAAGVDHPPALAALPDHDDEGSLITRKRAQG